MHTALELSLTGSGSFADSAQILAKVRATYELFTEIFGGNTVSCIDPGDDPVLRRWLDDRFAVERGAAPFPAFDDDVTSLSRPIGGTAGPTAFGIEVPTVMPEGDPWHRAHRRLFAEVLNPASRDIHLVPATEPELTHIHDALALLETVSPDLSAGVLGHLKVVVLVGGEHAFESASDRRLPRAGYINRAACADPLRLAEALIHEATHQKLYDLQLLYTLYAPGYRPEFSPTVRPAWHPADTVWSIDRTLAAAHVYVHLTRMFDEMSRGLPVDLDPAQLRRTAGRARRRADMLLAALDGHSSQFNASGLAFLTWLREAHGFPLTAPHHSSEADDSQLEIRRSR